MLFSASLAEICFVIISVAARYSLLTIGAYGKLAVAFVAYIQVVRSFAARAVAETLRADKSVILYKTAVAYRGIRVYVMLLILIKRSTAVGADKLTGMPRIRLWRHRGISVAKHTDLSSVAVDTSYVTGAVLSALGTVKAGSTVAVLILVLGRLCSFGVCRSVGSASGGNVGGIVLWRLCIIRGRLRRNVAIFAYTLFRGLKRAGAGVAALGADKAVVELCVASVANRVLGVYVILLVYAKLAAAMAADKRSGVTGLFRRRLVTIVATVAIAYTAVTE